MNCQKICPHCNEQMIYGTQLQTIYKHIISQGKRIEKTRNYIIFGWRCQMNEDYCDIIIDKKDNHINNVNRDYCNKLLDLELNAELE